VVTIKDDSPGTATATATGTANVAEGDVLTAGPLTVTPFEGQDFNGTVATFTDSNAANKATDFTATINWGDGTTTTGTVVGSNGSFLVQGSHTYPDEGSFPVSVTIKDDAPGTPTATAAGNRQRHGGRRPDPQPADLQPDGGQSFTGAVATFGDSDTANTAADFTATHQLGRRHPHPGHRQRRQRPVHRHRDPHLRRRGFLPPSASPSRRTSPARPAAMANNPPPSRMATP